MTESILDPLPGVGPSRRTALVKHFGSTRNLLRASPEEIAKVPGLGPELAERIYEHLRIPGARQRALR